MQRALVRSLRLPRRVSMGKETLVQRSSAFIDVYSLLSLRYASQNADTGSFPQGRAITLPAQLFRSVFSPIESPTHPVSSSEMHAQQKQNQSQWNSFLRRSGHTHTRAQHNENDCLSAVVKRCIRNNMSQDKVCGTRQQNLCPAVYFLKRKVLSLSVARVFAVGSDEHHSRAARHE